MIIFLTRIKHVKNGCWSSLCAREMLSNKNFQKNSCNLNVLFLIVARNVLYNININGNKLLVYKKLL